MNTQMMNLCSFPISQRGSISFFFLAIFASSLVAFANQPIRFSPLPGTINIPDAWSVKPMSAGAGNFAAAAASSDKSESLSLYVSPIGEPGPLSENSSYIKGFLKTCADHNATVGSARHETINGLDFYVLPVTQKFPSAELDALTYFGISGGHIYQIAFYQKNSDPSKNSDYAKILASFAPSTH